MRLNGGGGSLIRALTVDDPSMAQTRWASRRSTYFASWSTSMLTRLPGASRPSVVTSRVCGISHTSKPSSASAETVSETPATATEPFSTR